MPKCTVRTVLKAASILCAICALVFGTLEIMTALLPYLTQVSLNGAGGSSATLIGFTVIQEGTFSTLMGGILFAALAGVFYLLSERYNKSMQ